MWRNYLRNLSKNSILSEEFYSYISLPKNQKIKYPFPHSTLYTDMLFRTAIDFFSFSNSFIIPHYPGFGSNALWSGAVSIVYSSDLKRSRKEIMHEAALHVYHYRHCFSVNFLTFLFGAERHKRFEANVRKSNYP